MNGYSNQFGNTWRWNILATEPEYESVYAGLYNVITRCNFMLDNVDRVRQNTTNDDDLDRLDQYCGEAYFARALAYSELIKLFCKAYDPATAANELGVVLKSHCMVTNLPSVHHWKPLISLFWMIWKEQPST